MRSIRDIFRSFAVFDTDGRHVNGTDKESNHHYGDAYERILSETDHSHNMCDWTPDKRTRSCLECSSDTSHRYGCTHRKVKSIRESVRLMMEIGVADGSSLLAWREVFPNAQIVGMDIHPSARATGERIEFHLGDIGSLRDCRRVTAKRQFDLIVEDATHCLTDTLRAILYLWPAVKPGGMYVVEEFENIGELRDNVLQLWRDGGGCGKSVRAEVVDTISPSGGVESLVVIRKPL